MNDTARRDGQRRVHIVFGVVSAALAASIPIVSIPYYATVAAIVLSLVVLAWLAYAVRR